jgi:hypothetical protein
MQIIDRSLSDIEYVRSLQGHVGKLVSQAYIKSLTYTHGESYTPRYHFCSSKTVLRLFDLGVSVIGAVVALVAAFCIREHRL